MKERVKFVLLEKVGSGNSFKQSYGFAKILAEEYKNLLLLTATPHNGHRDCFASLLEMIHPQLVTEEASHKYPN